MKEKEFYSQKGTYKRVPLSKKIKAEKLIPIDIFDKFKSKGSYFLESAEVDMKWGCLLYTSPSPRDVCSSRMPSSA